MMTVGFITIMFICCLALPCVLCAKVKNNPPGCGVVKTIPDKAQKVTVSSFDFPSPLPADAECVWKFTTGKDYKIYIHAVEIVLGTKDDCSTSIQVSGNEKVCKTPSKPIAWTNHTSSADLYIRTAKDNHAVKLKVLVSSIKMPRFYYAILDSEKHDTTTTLTEPKFPGPLPANLHMEWMIISRYGAAIYLDSFDFPSSSSCADAKLEIAHLKTVCSDTDRTSTGYVGFLKDIIKMYRVKLLTKNTPYVKFTIRFDHTNGGWSDYRELKKCTAKCGSGTKLMIRTCTNPSPSVKDKGCFIEDHRTRKFNETKTLTCSEECQMSPKETLYSVSLALKISPPISTEQFNGFVGPALKKLFAARITDYCNKNVEKCCGSPKKLTAGVTYAFIDAASIHFTSDTPYHNDTTVKVSLYVIPPKDNELCSAKRRKRSPTSFEGAMPKKVLYDALKPVNKVETTSTVDTALKAGGLSNTVSVSSEVSQVQPVAPLNSGPPRNPFSTPEPFYLLYLKIILPMAIGIMLF